MTGSSNVRSQSGPRTEDAIDAVVAWVDGQDPRHVERMRPYRTEGHHPDGTSKTRFTDSGELRFCLTSIQRHAPYVRRIFLVTDDQVPRYLPDLLRSVPELEDKLEIVDHRVVFEGYEHALPTFNSIAIEATLHRIPGLAERFVYFNDDFFLAHDLPPEHFFGPDGPVLRGQWKPFYEDRMSYRFKRFLDRKGARAARPGFITSQQRAARRTWSGTRYLQIGHIPHPLRRSTLEGVYGNDPELFERQISHRFRHTEQLSTISLANHAELAEETARVVREDRVGYLKAERASHVSIERLVLDLREGRFDTLCLQSIDLLAPQMSTQLEAGTEAFYGVPPLT